MSRLKIISVVGARPQFIKVTTVSREIAKHSNLNEIIVHTGQHFEENMSDVFFKELKIPKPKCFLDINGLSHGAMTGQMLEKIEDVLCDHNLLPASRCEKTFNEKRKIKMKPNKETLYAGE